MKGSVFLKIAPVIYGFAAGALCSFAAMSMTDESTIRRIKRKTNQTMRTVGTIASGIADIVR